MPPKDDPTARPAPGARRLKVVARGAVQGVGFRPFVHRLAAELGLAGWVRNSSEGALIEAEGLPEGLRTLLCRLQAEQPPPCTIQSLESSWLEPVGHVGFTIQSSEASGPPTALVLPDIVTCAECRREMLDPTNRRYLYPFTNCTHCGPRYSIIEALPYDRARTSMRKFRMCEQCQAEYESPSDRRFHAQPNACPLCGPHLEFWDRNGRVLASHRQALLAAVEALRRGSIVAVKGLGGFQLMVTALCEASVRGLRLLKHREEKPFAVMFPSLDSVRQQCEVSPLEERLLTSPEGPIVLLRRRPDLAALYDLHAAVVPAVAPGHPDLGVLLPTTPLHHLLLLALGIPVVATSGNLSDEPICTDEREALSRLRGLAEFFLVHDRPIVRHVDDSVARVVLGRELVLRRARGYAPLPVPCFGLSAGPPGADEVNRPVVLAVGAHLKNAVALGVRGQVLVSQHIGDLETEPAVDAMRRVAADLQHLYEVRPTVIAADLHPDYLSTQFAEGLAASAGAGTSLVRVQHHYAHVLAAMAENESAAPALGVAWDGTGYGLDGTVWGGEFLTVTDTGFVRTAHLRTFVLPGAERAVREPRRSALGILHQTLGEDWEAWPDLAPLRAFQPAERTVLRKIILARLNTPVTSSAGRLFDAVASLLGLRQVSRHEGQAAMDLEFACDESDPADGYPFPILDSPNTPEDPWVLDWAPLIRAILAEVAAGVPVGCIAMRFHRALADGIVAVAQRAGISRVVLTGGCFQNRILLEQAVGRLQAAGFQPYWPQRIPPNDGGIAAGQALAALRLRRAS